jgi:hypothetical protein
LIVRSQQRFDSRSQLVVAGALCGQDRGPLGRVFGFDRRKKDVLHATGINRHGFPLGELTLHATSARRPVEETERTQTIVGPKGELQRRFRALWFSFRLFAARQLG